MTVCLIVWLINNLCFFNLSIIIFYIYDIVLKLITKMVIIVIENYNQIRS